MGEVQQWNKKNIDPLALDGTQWELAVKHRDTAWFGSNAVYPDNSNGIEIHNPRFLRQKEKQLKKVQRKLSKMKFGSNNYKKQLLKVQKIHTKVTNQRKDFLHKQSYHIAKNHAVVCVEDLNIRNMIRNRKISRLIQDAGWSIFRSMIEYKYAKFSNDFVKVEPHFTTQDCSTCGTRVKKSLSIRTHICPACGTVFDRDLNAAINIKKVGLTKLEQAVS